MKNMATQLAANIETNYGVDRGTSHVYYYTPTTDSLIRWYGLDPVKYVSMTNVQIIGREMDIRNLHTYVGIGRAVVRSMTPVNRVRELVSGCAGKKRCGKEVW